MEAPLHLKILPRMPLDAQMGPSGDFWRPKDAQDTTLDAKKEPRDDFGNPKSAHKMPFEPKGAPMVKKAAKSRP